MAQDFAIAATQNTTQIMSAAAAICSMEHTAKTARELAKAGVSSKFMHGYYCGQIDAYAIGAGLTDEVVAVKARLQAEIEKAMNERKPA